MVTSVANVEPSTTVVLTVLNVLTELVTRADVKVVFEVESFDVVAAAVVLLGEVPVALVVAAPPVDVVPLSVVVSAEDAAADC